MFMISPHIHFHFQFALERWYIHRVVVRTILQFLDVGHLLLHELHFSIMFSIDWLQFWCILKALQSFTIEDKCGKFQECGCRSTIKSGTMSGYWFSQCDQKVSQTMEFGRLVCGFTNLLNSCRLFYEIKAVYSGIIFVQLVCGTWFIAASLFQMDMVWEYSIKFPFFP